MHSTFTRRPILSAVISIMITLLGAIALARLPMALFPAVAPPEVNVTVEYTGANAETVAKAAIVPLERAINGVPRMKYMSSDMGNDGVGVVQILFETGTDPDVAAVNVQNRVNSVMGELPPEVLKNGIKIAKRGGARLEDSATGKPSRKSTRKSTGRLKQSASLHQKAVRTAHSAKTRAAKARR